MEGTLRKSKKAMRQWSVRNAIIEQEKSLDLMRWANTPDAPFVPVPPLEEEKPDWSLASLYTFAVGMLP